MKTEKLRTKESTVYLWLSLALLMPGLYLALIGDVLRLALVLAAVAVFIALAAYTRITETQAQAPGTPPGLTPAEKARKEWRGV